MASEKIIHIKDVDDGYDVITDKQIIELRLDMGQDCCEQFGYFMSEDDLNHFVGSRLKSIAIVDTACNVKQVEELGSLDCGNTMFVNIDTTKGLLQFVAYNSHNGYYGHSASVSCEQLKESVVL